MIINTLSEFLSVGLNANDWEVFCFIRRDMEHLSDEALLDLAYQVGAEIDRRWVVGGGQESVRFKDCQAVFLHFHYRLWAKSQEHLYALLLNHQNHLIEECLITLGTVDASLIHAREVFAPAIEKRASSVILVHNHPTGIAAPSAHDLLITKRLKKVGKLIGIPLLDHLIIGKNQYYSESLKRMVYL